MDNTKPEPLKLSEMIMCGDHPSVTKTELNVKLEDKEKERNLLAYTMSRLSATASRTDKTLDRQLEQIRTTSEHAMRLIGTRKRGRSMEAVARGDVNVSASGNRDLVQAALGSFRWPPYLLAVWVLVLVLTHLLHCLVSVLEKALPGLNTWTEDCWKTTTENYRFTPIFLGLLTGLLYSMYFGMYAIFAVAVWSVEPLCCETEENSEDVKVTNYVNEVQSKINNSLKQT